MSVRIDLVGETFSNLKVLEYIGCDNTHAVYACKCLKCGSITNVTASNLKSGISKGCNKCKSYKFDLEMSYQIYEEYTLTKITQEELAIKYNCSRFAIRSALSRIKELNDVNTGD